MSCSSCRTSPIARISRATSHLRIPRSPAMDRSQRRRRPILRGQEVRTNLSIEDDRLAHLLMRGDVHAGYDEARRRLDRAALVLTADGAAGLPWGQAALLTAAECGVRMFPGGVYLGSDFADTTVVGQFGRWPLRRHLELAGCRTTNAPGRAVALHVGADRWRMQNGALRWADGWAGLVGIEAPGRSAPTPATRSAAWWRAPWASATSSAARGSETSSPAAGRRDCRHRRPAAKMSTTSISPTCRRLTGCWA